MHLKIDENDDTKDMTMEEIEFIRHLLNSFNDIYMQRLDDIGQSVYEPHQFKIAVQNPRDHNDSIIIYIMRSKRWEI
jgi:hypothetical protein